MTLGDDNTFGISAPEPIVDGQFEDTTDEGTVEENTEIDSTPDGQVEEETVEGEDTEQQVQTEQPLIDGKFKSVDDLLKAYKSLQAEFTRNRQQAKASKEEQPSNAEDNEERLIAWYNETVKTDPVRANATLAQYMAQKEFNAYKEKLEDQFKPIVQEREQQSIIQNTATKYKDFFDYQESIESEIHLMGEEDPKLLDDPKLYEIAYQRVKIKDLESKVMNAFENGKKSALQNKQAKKNINNETLKSKNNEDADIAGLNIIPESDGVFF